MPSEETHEYDFTGLEIHDAYIVSDQVRKKIQSIKNTGKTEAIKIEALKDLDGALSEYIYQQGLIQEQKRIKGESDPKSPQ